MLSVVLGRSWLLVGVLVALFLVTVPFGVLWATRRKGPRTPVVLFALAASIVLAATLTPVGLGDAQWRYCTVTSPWDGVLNESGMLNVVLFMPFTLFLTLITSRPAMSAATGAVSSVAIETVQALAPHLGRLCDTSDIAANTLGAMGGSVVALALMRWFTVDYGAKSALPLWGTLVVAVPAVAFAGVVVEFQGGVAGPAQQWERGVVSLLGADAVNRRRRMSGSHGQDGKAVQYGSAEERGPAECLVALRAAPPCERAVQNLMREGDSRQPGRKHQRPVDRRTMHHALIPLVVIRGRIGGIETGVPHLLQQALRITPISPCRFPRIETGHFIAVHGIDEVVARVVVPQDRHHLCPA
nr:VanZ family protein [Sinosporangium siamense]